VKLARMKEWREARGLSQRELASVAGVGAKTIARIELDDSVRPTTARKVARALDVSVSDLMEHPPVPLSEPSPSRKVRVGDVLSEARMSEIEAEHRRLNAAREAKEITPEFYLRRMSDLYAAMHKEAQEEAEKRNLLADSNSGASAKDAG
jgi:transcriptional regulator with XRE-family HTH domain